MKHCIAKIFILSIFIFSCSNREKFVVLEGYAQGGTYSVKYNTRTNDGGVFRDNESLSKEVDSLLVLIDNSLSGYNKLSTLSQFNRGEVVSPNDFFLDIYKKSYSYFEFTDGAVDVAAAPLFDLWGFGFTSNKLPIDEDVTACMMNIGMRRLKKDIDSCIDPMGRLNPKNLLQNEDVTLPKLNYNAVAQGYACDVIAQYLDTKKITDYLIFVGGEIYCKGKNPKGKQWTIAIDSPKDGNFTPGADIQKVFSAPENGCGVVTSGNYRKFYEKDGRKYAHTIDPRTGYPVNHNLLSATIIAADATVADALATFCMVVGFEKAKDFLAEHPEYKAVLIYDEDGKFKTWTTSTL